MREDVPSLRTAAAEYTKLMAEPTEEAKAEEEAEQPETDLVEPDEETEQVEETEESEEQPDEVEESENPNVEEIEFEGAKYNVPKELKEAFLRQSDYTKKTQELAEKVKAETDTKVKEATADLEKKRQGLVETTELLEQFIGKPTVTTEQMDAMLAEGDTEGYLKAQQHDKQRSTLITALKSERAKVQQEQLTEYEKQQAEHARQQTEILLTKVPELKDDGTQKSLIEYAKSEGWNDKQLKHTVESVYLVALSKAQKWDEMVKTGVKPKPKSKSPKVTKKAGSIAPKSAKRSQTVKARQTAFNESGSIRDAGKLYTAMLSKK